LKEDEYGPREISMSTFIGQDLFVKDETVNKIDEIHVKCSPQYQL